MARKEDPGKKIRKRKPGDPLSERTRKALAGPGFVAGTAPTPRPTDTGTISRSAIVSAEAKVRAGGAVLTQEEQAALAASRIPTGPTQAQRQAQRLQQIKRADQEGPKETTPQDQETQRLEEIRQRAVERLSPRLRQLAEERGVDVSQETAEATAQQRVRQDLREETPQEKEVRDKELQKRFLELTGKKTQGPGEKEKLKSPEDLIGKLTGAKDERKDRVDGDSLGAVSVRDDVRGIRDQDRRKDIGKVGRLPADSSPLFGGQRFDFEKIKDFGKGALDTGKDFFGGIGEIGQEFIVTPGKGVLKTAKAFGEKQLSRIPVPTQTPSGLKFEKRDIKFSLGGEPFLETTPGKPIIADPDVQSGVVVSALIATGQFGGPIGATALKGLGLGVTGIEAFQFAKTPSAKGLGRVAATSIFAAPALKDIGLPQVKVERVKITTKTGGKPKKDISFLENIKDIIQRKKQPELPITGKDVPVSELFAPPKPPKPGKEPKIPKTIKVTGIGLEKGGRSIGVTIGAPKDPIPLESLTGPIAAPRTAVGTKALLKSLDVTPQEKLRVAKVQEIIRVQKGEKGAEVKDVLFQLETLKTPKESSKIIIKSVAEDKGIIFGSTTLQQLPEGFRTKPGDIDIFFPKRTEAEIGRDVIPEIAKKLQAQGEKVRVGEKSPLEIETLEGVKVLEAKAGRGPIEISGEKVEGGLGFDFPDLERGLFTTAKFGPARATRAGEQLTRKGVASTFARPASAEAPPGFQEAGILPKGARSRDLPGFIVSSKGIAALQKGSPLPSKKVSAARAEKALDAFFETFTKEQQASLNEQIKDVGALKAVFGFEPKPKSVVPKDIPLPISGKDVPVSELFKRPSPAPGKAAVIIPVSPRPGKSPELKIPSIKISPTPKKSPEIRIPSPRPSPRPSPKPSPSPKLTSPAPSPTPKLVSPFPSPRPSPSPSPFPSPRPSPSPSPSPSQRPSPSPFVSPSLFRPSPKRKPKRESYNVLVKRRQGRTVLVKRNVNQHTKASAEGLLFLILDNSIAQTGKIKKAKRRVGTPSNEHARQADFLASKFRQKIRKGRFVSQPGDPYIEKRSHAIDTRGEKSKLKSARVASAVTSGRGIRSLFGKPQKQSRSKQRQSNKQSSKKKKNPFDKDMFDF